MFATNTRQNNAANTACCSPASNFVHFQQTSALAKRPKPLAILANSDFHQAGFVRFWPISIVISNARMRRAISSHIKFPEGHSAHGSAHPAKFHGDQTWDVDLALHRPCWFPLAVELQLVLCWTNPKVYESISYSGHFKSYVLWWSVVSV